MTNPITVVIPCSNYARFLPDCVRSVQATGVQRIVVIDDASADDPGKVCADFGVEYVRVEFRNLHSVRSIGLQLVRTKYVAFIDADNQVYPDYFRRAIAAMERHRNVAFVFPVLNGFGDAEGPLHGTENAPQIARAASIEDRNYCDGNAVWRTEVLHQTLALLRPLPADIATHDWRMAREVLRAGWLAIRSEVPLLYRVHSNQMSRNWTRYPKDATLSHERVTIVIAFSGRFECWKRVLTWLRSQTFKNVRLLIMNGTHADLSANDLGLGDWSRSLTIERFDAGAPGLGDENRTTGDEIRARVEAAVAGIYNRAVQMAAPDEYLFFLEDDVVPHSPSAIEKLLDLMQPETFAVSGLYKHRYQNKACAFRTPICVDNMLPLEGPAFEQVHGTGFGCLLARRSVLQSHSLSGDDGVNPHYDCELAARLQRTPWKWFLARTVPCDHLVGVQ